MTNGQWVVIIVALALVAFAAFEIWRIEHGDDDE